MFKNFKFYDILNFRTIFSSKKRLINMDKEKRESFDGDSNAIKVINALDNPKYKWRTAEGISKETGLTVFEVLPTISDLIKGGVAVSASTSAPTGEPIYTSTQRYLGKEYWLNRVLSVLSDEVK